LEHVENVRLIDRLTPRKSVVGTLYLSSTHTIFVENSDARKETWVLHSLVGSIERPPTTPSGSTLIIRCKNVQVYQLLLPQEKDCMDIQASLTRLSRPGEQRHRDLQ
uniref:MTMR6-9 GRAM domain-containing protein n=1 Tax=Astyanax mexicanus TaxID=7994 RepID=A0A8B9HI68_ASTMX